MSLGNLYSACKKSGLSQEDAAEKIGVSRSDTDAVLVLKDILSKVWKS